MTDPKETIEISFDDADTRRTSRPAQSQPPPASGSESSVQSSGEPHQSEINTLKKENKTLKTVSYFIAAIAIVNFAMLVLMVLTGTDTVKTRSIEIINQSGDTVAVIGAIEESENLTGFSVLDSEGTERILVGFDDENASKIVMLDEDGEESFTIPPELPDFELTLDYVQQIVTWLSMFL